MRDAQASGRFDATEADRAHLWAVLARHADVAGTTEDRGRDEPARWSGAGGESAVYWQEPWRCRRVGTVLVPTPEWQRGTARVAAVEIAWALLEHPDGWTLLRAAVHLPAHLIRKAQRKANRSACRQLVPTLERLRAETGADEVTLSGDFNFHLRLERNRGQLERDGYRVVAPKRGTHGIRPIDGFLTTMRGTATRLRRFPGYDHWVVVANLHRISKEHR